MLVRQIPAKDIVIKNGATSRPALMADFKVCWSQASVSNPD